MPPESNDVNAANAATDAAKPPTPAQGESTSRVEAMVDDVIGVDFKILRTIRDLIVHPRRVTDAALAGDRSRYTPPLRVFLAIITLQTMAFGWLGIFDLNTVHVAFADQPEAIAAAEAVMADAGSTLAQADAVISKWVSWINWPIIVLSSLLYAVVIWMLRPSVGLYAGFMLYLVATNASSALTLPLMIIASFLTPTWLAIASTLGVLTFWIYCGVVMQGRIAQTGVGLGMRLGVIVVTTLPIVALVYASLSLVLNEVLKSEVGVSLFTLYGAAMSAI